MRAGFCGLFKGSACIEDEFWVLTGQESRWRQRSWWWRWRCRGDDEMTSQMRRLRRRTQEHATNDELILCCCHWSHITRKLLAPRTRGLAVIKY